MSASDLDSPHSLQVLQALRKLASGTRLRTHGLNGRVARKLDLNSLDVEEAFRDLRRAGLLEFTADARGLPVSGYIDLVAEEVVSPPHVLAWQEALVGAQFSDAVSAVLVPFAAKLADMPAQDMRFLALSLQKLAQGPGATEDSGFNASARNVLGSSKILSQLASPMLQALGLPARLRLSSPRYVLCAGPAQPKAILLIENPRAFENAVACVLSDSVALVCTYGFALAYMGQEFIHADECPENDRPIQINRAGSPPPFRELFALERAFFWADLDRAAFSIYRSMRNAIPHLRLSGIYHAMMPMLARPESSHPYCTLVKKDGQVEVDFAKGAPIEGELCELWTACATRAVDQEAVREADILRWGHTSYVAGAS